MDNIRVQREIKKTKKDFDLQIKKSGKIIDNAVCAPDPDNILEWFFVIWGLDGNFQGGYFLGKVILPQTYPKTPPKVKVIVQNGHFERNSEICMSMTDMHPESWSPIWTVQKVVLALASFWTDPESSYTSGAVHYSGSSEHQQIKREYDELEGTLLSRQETVDHAKFAGVFSDYVDFIGIKDEFDGSKIEEKLAAVKK